MSFSMLVVRKAEPQALPMLGKCISIITPPLLLISSKIFFLDLPLTYRAMIHIKLISGYSVIQGYKCLLFMRILASFYVNITQARVILERGSQLRKMSSLDWSVWCISLISD